MGWAGIGFNVFPIIFKPLESTVLNEVFFSFAVCCDKEIGIFAAEKDRFF